MRRNKSLRSLRGPWRLRRNLLPGRGRARESGWAAGVVWVTPVAGGIQVAGVEAEALDFPEAASDSRAEVGGTRAEEADTQVVEADSIPRAVRIRKAGEAADEAAAVLPKTTRKLLL